MNENQIKGTAKDISGKVQRKVGEMTDNGTEQVKGTARQVEGKIQKGIGNAQENAENERNNRDRQ